MDFSHYEHHGADVVVRADLKGRHREHCLCFSGCVHFKPGEPDNCEIAQELYQLCVKHDLTTPVFECPKFDQGTKEKVSLGNRSQHPHMSYTAHELAAWVLLFTMRAEHRDNPVKKEKDLHDAGYYRNLLIKKIGHKDAMAILGPGSHIEVWSITQSENSFESCPSTRWTA